VIRKVEGPSWAPTPAMRERNPEWPARIGPGPDNPLGTHALYLSWHAQDRASVVEWLHRVVQ